ncbi:MAG: hypothetical protein NTU41_13930, partial [Chloroflexi bacterium]|nr:hypothetical protein [Chloroflexota bacterium]
MPDFEDYSSALITNTTNVEEILKNFSKDALARIAQMGSTEILRMDAGYFTYATAMFGQPLALELDAEIWRRAAWTVIRRAKQFFNIEGSDVATLFKCYQVDPGTIGTMVDVEYQLKDNNHGILTVKKCLSLG